MRRKLTALLLALLLALSGMGLADGEPSGDAPEAAEPAPEPEKKAEPEPEPAKAAESEPEPEQAAPEEDALEEEVSSSDSEEAPPAGQDEEAPSEPAEPTEAPADDPAEDGGGAEDSPIEPIDEPLAAANGELTTEPGDEPDGQTDSPVNDSLTIVAEGATQSGDVWRFPAGSATLQFSWDSIDGASYHWTIEEAGASGDQSGTTLELPAADYASGPYTLAVTAETEGGSASGSIRFAVEQAAQPDVPSGGLIVTAEGATQSASGAWQFPAGSTALRFSWAAVDGADEYQWEIAETGASGNATETALELLAESYASGPYTLVIRALSGGQTLGEASITFEIAASETPGGLTVTAEGAILSEEGVWQFPADSETLRFTWTALDGEYDWKITDAAGNPVASGSQTEAALGLPAREYASGRFTLTVTAQIDGQTQTASLTFELAQASGDRPGGRPGRFPGGFPGGRRGGFGGGFGGSRPSGGMLPEEEQGFHVTPGEALTDSHNSGTKDMTAYGAVALTLPEEPVTQLELGGALLDVRRADGGGFTVELAEGVLTLRAQDATADGEWIVNPLALRTLQLSGVSALALDCGEAPFALPTGLEFSGAIYASYRVQGRVAKDFELRVSANGARACIDGASYALTEGGELAPLEG